MEAAPSERKQKKQRVGATLFRRLPTRCSTITAPLLFNDLNLLRTARQGRSE